MPLHLELLACLTLLHVGAPPLVVLPCMQSGSQLYILGESPDTDYPGDDSKEPAIYSLAKL